MEHTTEAPRQTDHDVGRIPEEDADRWLELFSILIHDIESPMASMKYLLNMLAENKLDLSRAQHQKLVESTKIAIERSESIFYDIMAVAKAGKVGVPVDVVKTSFEPIVKNALSLSAGYAEEKQVSVVYQSSLADQAITADPNLLRRMLDNLLYNAIRHTPSGGQVTMRIEDESESILIHIKDSGPGLGDADPQAMFEKYGQLELRRQGQHRGVGLGLYFCRLAATGMGAVVMADDHPDGGSVFSVKLRKAKE